MLFTSFKHAQGPGLKVSEAVSDLKVSEPVGKTQWVDIQDAQLRLMKYKLLGNLLILFGRTRDCSRTRGSIGATSPTIGM
jgi:hypothetical protein